MNNYTKDKFFYWIIFLSVLFNSYKTNLFAMECSSALNTEMINKLFFNYMRFMYSTYFVPEIVFNNGHIAQDDPKTIMTVENLKTIQLFLSVNKQYHTMFKSVYIDLLKKLLNSCCYDKKYYEFDQNIGKETMRDNTTNYFNKRVSRNSMEMLAYVLSSNTTYTDSFKIVADICTFSEGNYYVKHNIQAIITQIGRYYESITNPVAQDRLLCENKKSIYENNLEQLITHNSPKLLLFIQKLFDYTQYKNYTMFIKIDSSIEKLSISFIDSYKKHNFQVFLNKQAVLNLALNKIEYAYYLGIKVITNPSA